ncbi:hypothetical protein HanXRQr2_Chr05g0209521 [Helianthus annuus]|uniref:Uncharacterized protein n=1 Tax=Helianthus annuus TaxID=4232 RepID=A0A9K3J0K6_HELAN|nr:hypothetical protein HanXRQr2_Chr05g0209521 [Helianthus annuus]KAJ0922333.1 hypothetical protein HanPSC8_Chr05g0202571 [Helianthus annuus]
MPFIQKNKEKESWLARSRKQMQKFDSELCDRGKGMSLEKTMGWDVVSCGMGL